MPRMLSEEEGQRTGLPITNQQLGMGRPLTGIYVKDKLQIKLFVIEKKSPHIHANISVLTTNKNTHTNSLSQYFLSMFCKVSCLILYIILSL